MTVISLELNIIRSIQSNLHAAIVTNRGHLLIILDIYNYILWPVVPSL